MVIFRKSDHSYRHKDVKYASVSSIFELVKPKTDWDYNAGRSFFKENYPDLYEKVKKSMGFDNPDLINKLRKLSKISLEDLNKEIKSIRSTWSSNNEAKTSRGTNFHTKMENIDYENGWAINPFTKDKTTLINIPKEFDNQSIAENLYDLEDGYYPELLLFNHRYKMAGQSDRIFITTKGDKRFFYIDDWKTDANINLKPDFRHPKKGYEKLNYPLSHLYNTNYNTYMIKIGMYAWMLKEFGYELGGICFTSVEINDDLDILNEKRYILPYKEWEVKAVLDYYKESKT